jgi:hypothetical protein
MIAALALALAAPVAAPGQIDPTAFFRGRTHGEGTLKILLQKPRRISVESNGRVEPGGGLLLTQVISGGGKAPRTRQWRMRQTAPNRFDGTLSDAAGPVTVERIGERLRIRYTDNNRFQIEQWLTPAGPRQINNVLRVKRLGITIARLDEVIRKVE